MKRNQGAHWREVRARVPMPLEKGKSEAVISHNIREMREAGHPERIAVAAAEREADKSRNDRGITASLPGGLVEDVAPPMDLEKLDAVLGAVGELQKKINGAAERVDSIDEERCRRDAEEMMRADEHIGWDAMMKKLEGRGYSAAVATKIAGKIAAEKGETGHH